MELERLVHIPGDELRPHPDNPRKDLGDLEELTDSIRKHGIMQNLTVMPTKDLAGGDPESNHYTILMGHRRYAAAKAAGVNEFPCRIVRGLSHSEQVALMLEENIQRNDLTIIEQAEGMQMLLDLGESYESITEITGFSESTVRHRVNLLKLDRDVLTEKQHQLTLKDLAKLESIPEDRRDEVLKYSTSSKTLEAEVDRVKADEERKKRREAVEKYLKGIGMSEDKNIRGWQSGIITVRTSDPHWQQRLVEELESRGANSEDAEYNLETYSDSLYIDPCIEDEEDEEDLEPTIEDLAREANEKRENKMDSIVKTEMERLYEKLVEYAINDNGDKDPDDSVMADMAREYMRIERSNHCYFSNQIDVDNVMTQIAEEKTPEGMEPENIDKLYDDLSTSTKIILRAAEYIDKPYDWNHYHRPSPCIRRIQDMLLHIPFVFSPEMQELIDGTSPLYEEITEETLEQ